MSSASSRCNCSRTYGVEFASSVASRVEGICVEYLAFAEEYHQAYGKIKGDPISFLTGSNSLHERVENQ